MGKWVDGRVGEWVNVSGCMFVEGGGACVCVRCAGWDSGQQCAFRSAAWMGGRVSEWVGGWVSGWGI